MQDNTPNTACPACRSLGRDTCLPHYTFSAEPVIAETENPVGESEFRLRRKALLAEMRERLNGEIRGLREAGAKVDLCADSGRIDYPLSDGRTFPVLWKSWGPLTRWSTPLSMFWALELPGLKFLHWHGGLRFHLTR